MSKKPEEMAKEFAAINGRYDPLNANCRWGKNAFIAGYKAAQEHADSCEHILDMSKMVDVNGWISVKDRLPEHLGLIANEVIVCTEYEEVKTAVRKMDGWIDIENRLEKKTSWVTHWMPLPDRPKEEK
jgi:hypothetical protein